MGPDEIDVPNSMSQQLAYTRGLYIELLDWYKSAESKATFLLTIDGIFTTALSGLVIIKSEELDSMLPQ